MVLLEILAAVILISLISLVGIATLWFSSVALRRFMTVFIGFAAGAMLGAAFFEILPEAIELSSPQQALFLTSMGVVFFFLIESYLHWHHHVDEKGTHKHPMGYLNIIGDALHNFVDGAFIAAAFLTSVPLGIVATIAAVAHEIPQELADFSILLHSGFEAKQALVSNFMTALTAILGALVAFYASSSVPDLAAIVLPFAAGSFIYIAMVDIVPEIHKLKQTRTAQVAALLIGLIAIWVVSTVLEA